MTIWLSLLSPSVVSLSLFLTQRDFNFKWQSTTTTRRRHWNSCGMFLKIVIYAAINLHKMKSNTRCEDRERKRRRESSVRLMLIKNKQMICSRNFDDFMSFMWEIYKWEFYNKKKAIAQFSRTFIHTCNTPHQCWPHWSVCCVVKKILKFNAVSIAKSGVLKAWNCCKVISLSYWGWYWNLNFIVSWQKKISSRL